MSSDPKTLREGSKVCSRELNQRKSETKTKTRAMGREEGIVMGNVGGSEDAGPDGNAIP
jgi:hypothetical protein